MFIIFSIANQFTKDFRPPDQGNGVKNLSLITERNEKNELRKLSYNQTKAERKTLTDAVLDETLRRLQLVTHGELNAIYGDTGEKKTAQ